MAETDLAGGRPLPTGGLLFVTTEDTLCRFGDRDKAEKEIRAIVRFPHTLLILDHVADHTKIARKMHKPLRAYWGSVHQDEHDGGVVLIGGHETLPSEPKNSIAAPIPVDLDDEVSTETLDSDPSETGDDDNFMVWTDDRYADIDRDGVADLPVSRIPTDTDLCFLLDALRASGEPVTTSLRGFRTPEFPAADIVYAKLKSMTSSPSPMGAMNALPDRHLPISDLAGDALYLVLHGGRGSVMSIYNIYDHSGYPRKVITAPDLRDGNPPPPRCGSVVFSACCYSGQITTQRAYDASDAALNLTQDTSVALAFLSLGEVAVIGFTAYHWVSNDLNLTLFGWPLHERFWRNYLDKHNPPARALFIARREYIANAPQNVFTLKDDLLLADAVTMKTFWSATCLGLGW